MVDATHTCLIADDRSYFSLIKKDIRNLAINNGFSTEKINNIDIIVAEITSNLHKHTVKGAEILYNYTRHTSGDYIEIISIDNGPGIKDTRKAMTDGYSSSSTLGHGFGSIQRLSNVFELYSVVDWGTIVLVRIYKHEIKKRKEPVIKHELVIVKPGEATSGDGCYYLPVHNGFRYLLADGLGHGKDANEAVNKAAEVFQSLKDGTLTEAIKTMHAAVRKTRGLVANIVAYDFNSKQWRVCGIGNISTRFISATSVKSFVPYNGIIGHNIPTSINDMILPEEYNGFISCSDGLRSRWDISKFPLINKYDPAILSAALYKEYARKNDDMSVVICKIK